MFTRDFYSYIFSFGFFFFLLLYTANSKCLFFLPTTMPIAVANGSIKHVYNAIVVEYVVVILNCLSLICINFNLETVRFSAQCHPMRTL